MDFKKKLKQRLYIGIIYIIVGILIIGGTFIVKTKNDVISTFGFVLALLGIVRIRNYFLITKNEDTIKKHEIYETDERNISIQNKAKSATFSIYIFLCGIAVSILSVLERQELAVWIGYSVIALTVIYWICYWIYQKKL